MIFMMKRVIRGDFYEERCCKCASKDGVGDGNGYGRYVGGSSLVSFDPRGDGKSEVVSDVEVTGPDQRGFLLLAETN